VGAGYGNAGNAGFDVRDGAADAGQAGFRFSGFSGELAGSPSAIARPHRRVTTEAGRAGRVWTGTVGKRCAALCAPEFRFESAAFSSAVWVINHFALPVFNSSHVSYHAGLNT
jgi:hypothetical protein